MEEQRPPGKGKGQQWSCLESCVGTRGGNEPRTLEGENAQCDQSMGPTGAVAAGPGGRGWRPGKSWWDCEVAWRGSGKPLAGSELERGCFFI